MTTLTFPMSRIEGHARVVIEIHNGAVISAHFQAMELRGFEQLVQGTPAEQMPVIVPRICGVCATAHHLASVGALEDAYQVVPPPLAVKIRELLYLGQLIQNQATSMFVFTLPDRLGLASIFEQAADSQTEEFRLDIANRSLKIRKAGTDLITLAGGQFIHPIKAVVGGVTSGISAEAASEMHTKLERALSEACILFEKYWEASVAMSENLGTWGDDTPAHYIAAIGGRADNYYSDVINVMSPEGNICDSFHPRDFQDYLTFEDTDYSYAGFTTYKGKMMRANSLARVNMGELAGLNNTDIFLQRFWDTFGRPAHAIMLYDLARGIE
jgi:F420-non-reducing hydrogenase large subunit